MKFLLILILSMGYSFSATLQSSTGFHKTKSSTTLEDYFCGIQVLSHLAVLTNIVENHEVLNPDSTKFHKLSYTNSHSTYFGGTCQVLEDLDVSVSLPLFWDQVRSVGDLNSGGFGDLKVSGKWHSPYLRTDYYKGLSLFSSITLPTALKDRGVLPRQVEFFTEDSLSTTTIYGGLFGLDLGMGLTGGNDFIWHSNVGIRQAFGGESSGAFYLRYGIEYEWKPSFNPYIEYAHDTRYENLFSKEQFGTEPNVISIGAIAGTRLPYSVQYGVSISLNRGYSKNHFKKGGNPVSYNYSVRPAPPFSLYLGYGWKFGGSGQKKDSDNDGVPDYKDKCISEPEDKDGIEDRDGCPEEDVIKDSDQDRVADEQDNCPTEKEDHDNFQDEDGCPDLDNDEDGVPDSADNCPDQSGSEADSGCPKESSNPFEAEGGLSLEGVNFEPNSASIISDSYDVLESVVEKLNDYPNINIEIQGHTDSRGDDGYNQRLSKKRAVAVRVYFISKGIEESRMTAVGYGEVQPIADNETVEGRKANRRIELKVIE